MAGERGGFTEPFVERLRTADHRMRQAERGQQAVRYAVCRTTISALTRVDSFYIGYFRDEETFFIPYIYDHDKFLRPDVGRFSKQGVSHWVRSSRKPYRFADDNGALLNHAIPFGNVNERSQDAIVVPLIDSEGEVAGLMSIQSVQPKVYDDEVVRALDWLGRALMHSFARDVAEQDELDLYSIYPELDSSRLRDEVDLIAEVNIRVDRIHTAIADLSTMADRVGGDIAEATRNVRALCERLQVEIGELVVRMREQQPTTGDPGPAASLTEREAEIAELIAVEQLTNAELATRLHISEKTVKTHVGNVLRKLGVSQRSAIAWTLNPTGDTPTRQA